MICHSLGVCVCVEGERERVVVAEKDDRLR